MNNTSFATLFFALAICCLTISNTNVLEAQTLRNLFFNSNENVVQLDFSTEPPTVLGTGTQGSLEGIVGYTEDPIVSSDVIGREETMVFDQKATMMTNDELLKTLCWYDNGWGLASRILDVVDAYATLEDK